MIRNTNNWLIYVRHIQSLLNDILANASEDEEGYSLDTAYAAWQAGVSPLKYASGERA